MLMCYCLWTRRDEDIESQTARQTDRKADRDRYRKADTDKDEGTYRDMVRQTDRHRDKDSETEQDWEIIQWVTMMCGK